MPKDALDQETPHLRNPNQTSASLFDTRPELSREDLSEQVVVVVDRGHCEVDLRSPRVDGDAGWGGYVLESLDQLPPSQIQVRFWVGVQIPFEMTHDQSPPDEDQSLRD